MANRWRGWLARLGLALALLGALAGGLPARGAQRNLLVRDIEPGFRGSDAGLAGGIVAVGDQVFFVARTAFGADLWVSDGTAANSRLVLALGKPAEPFYGRIGPMAAVDGALVFLIKGPGEAPALWRSDGTQAGTLPIFFMPGGHELAGSLMATRRGLYFFTAYTPQRTTIATWLWRSDGRPGGAVAVGELDEAGTAYQTVAVETAAADYVYASIQQPTSRVVLGMREGGSLTALTRCVYGCGMWPAVYGDGLVAAGSELAALDFFSGAAHRPLDLRGRGITALEHVTVAGDQVFFNAKEGLAESLGLWRTDGTLTGTLRLTSATGPLLSLVAFDGALYFLSRRDNRWVLSQVSQAGGVPEFVLDAGPAAGTAPVLRVMGGRLVVSADDEAHGRELWVTAGADLPPALLVDLFPGPGSSLRDVPGDSYLMASLRGGLVWNASDPEFGSELRFAEGGAAPYVLPAVAAAIPGGLATARLRFGNQGLTATEPLTLALRLPAGVVLARQTIGPAPTIAGDMLRWRLGALAAGERPAEAVFALPRAPLGTVYTATATLEPLGLSAPIRLEGGWQQWLTAAGKDW